MELSVSLKKSSPPSTTLLEEQLVDMTESSSKILIYPIKFKVKFHKPLPNVIFKITDSHPRRQLVHISHIISIQINQNTALIIFLTCLIPGHLTTSLCHWMVLKEVTKKLSKSWICTFIMVMLTVLFKRFMKPGAQLRRPSILTEDPSFWVKAHGLALVLMVLELSQINLEIGILWKIPFLKQWVSVSMVWEISW